jgi:hypothetical protein
LNNKLLALTLLLIFFISIPSPALAETTSVNITSKKEIKQLKSVAYISEDIIEILSLIKIIEVDSTTKENSFTYQVFLGDTKKWEVKLPQKNSNFDQIIRNNQKSKSRTSSTKRVSRKKFTGDSENLTNYERDYQMTPWTSTKPFYLEDSLPKKLIKWFYWKNSHAEFELTRHTMFNFGVDTINTEISLVKPVLTDNSLNLSYTHNWKFLWFGTGFYRSAQKSSYLDSIDTRADSWINRMGWNFHFAVPGFRYDIYRDPSVIPKYGRYDRELFVNLEPNKSHEFLWELDMDEKNIYDTIFNPIDTIKGSLGGVDTTIIIHDTVLVKYNLTRKRKPGHKFTFKVGHLRYSLILDPDRYLGAIQELMLKDMPFFKGSWDMGIFILPTGRVVPTGTVGFHTFHIPFGSDKRFAFDITPIKFTFQLTSQDEFYFALGFKTDFFINNREPIRRNK